MADSELQDLPAVTTPSGSHPSWSVEGGVDVRYTQDQVGAVSRLPVPATFFHNGISAVWTAPTAATDAELATIPMSRILADLQKCSQARLVVGMRTLGTVYTTATLRAQYSTNGLTQTAWADLANVANAGNVSLLAGTANAIRASSWFDIAAAAKVADAVLRLRFVSTGTGTVAATVSFVDLLLK